MTTSHRRTVRFLLAPQLLAAAMVLASASAEAVLGGDLASVGSDQARLQGTRRQSQSLRVDVTTHEIGLADGSRIVEYASADGFVFAVRWSTRLKPDLSHLLGTEFPAYAAAATDALRRPGIQRRVRLERGDLVVESTAHLNAFVGRAYLRSRLPKGIDADQLR